MVRFGTGGWRGIIGQDFIDENIRRVAQALADLVAEGGRPALPVMLGFDRRFLSYDAARWFAEVLCGNGLTVWFMKRTAPTPLVMHTVKAHGLDFGVQVTASHNPANYNGIKFIVQGGRDAPEEVTLRLEALMEQAEKEGRAPLSLPFPQAEEQGQIVYLKNPFNGYIDDIAGKIRMDLIRERGLRVLFDPMHGSGAYPLMVLLYTARCTVDHIHFERDAYFGGNMPAPGEMSLAELRQKVATRGYDLGIAFDGDGDRLGIIDRDGRYVTANEILVLLYYYLHEHKGWKGPVVRNMSTTHMLDRLAASFGEECHEVPVGFKHVSAKIEQTDAVLGGESSGGLTVRGHIPGKDSIYAAALFVEAVCALNQSPSQILSGLYQKLGAHAMVEESLLFTEAQKEIIRRDLLERRNLPAFSHAVDRVSYLDGSKVYFTDGSFAVCRFSGTEPLLRLCAEAPAEAQAAGYLKNYKLHISNLLNQMT